MGGRLGARIGARPCCLAEPRTVTDSSAPRMARTDQAARSSQKAVKAFAAPSSSISQKNAAKARSGGLAAGSRGHAAGGRWAGALAGCGRWRAPGRLRPDGVPRRSDGCRVVPGLCRRGACHQPPGARSGPGAALQRYSATALQRRGRLPRGTRQNLSSLRPRRRATSSENLRFRRPLPEPERLNRGACGSTPGNSSFP